MDNIKIAKLQNWIIPHNVTKVHKFLGFIGYYCYFIQDYLKKAHPLLYLTAILSQEGESTPQTPQISHKKPKLHPIAYYSAMFTEMECNYDIYDRELLAIMKAIMHWRPYLI